MKRGFGNRRGVRVLPALAAIWLCLSWLCVGWFAQAPSAQAAHLKHAGKAELERALDLRLRVFPARHRQIPVAGGGAPRELARAVEALPAGIRGLIEGGSAISLLYYDGSSVVYDWKRADIPEDVPLYGASMSKSITSYLLGRALCEGHIQSLDDPVAKYVPALGGTFYGGVAIGDALDMTSGDRVLYADSRARGGRSQNREYNIPVMRRGVPVVDALRTFADREPAAHRFAYRNANTDAVALVIDRAVPGGLGPFAGRALAGDAGFARPAMYLGDRDGAAFAFAMFYATRMDWLRAAIRVGEEFNVGGCIGDYLGSAVAESVPTNVEPHPYRRYGKFFWSDRKRSNRRHVAMLGHGGQQAYIGLADNRVLLMHAIRGDYKPWRIFKVLFE